MKRSIWVIYLAAILSAGIVSSCQPDIPQDPRITKTMEKESLARMGELVRECRVCHGVEEAQRGPILDGMEYWYLYEQLQKFRSGIRGQNPENRSEHLMGIGVQKLNNDLESAYLADWFARQDPQPAVRTVRGDKERGKQFYEARCASCHGEKAEGNRLVAGPALNRLEGWYFLEQMRKFRSGQRGYHSQDETGQIMATASKGIADSTLKDVVAYIVDAYGPEDAPSMRDRMVPKKSKKPF
ncbi:MAG: c-type cytochrome [Opitutae bacterium]